jgi:two-component system C4-dicarboxylate transport response regulator DctD
MVFLVDDDDSMREAMGRLINLAGFGCASFASAEDFLARQPAGPGACVVSDLKLPGISGLELLDELRTRDAAPPLILITAHDSPGLQDEAMRRGAAAYLTKPFRGTALLDTINTVIGR